MHTTGVTIPLLQKMNSSIDILKTEIKANSLICPALSGNRNDAHGSVTAVAIPKVLQSTEVQLFMDARYRCLNSMALLVAGASAAVYFVNWSYFLMTQDFAKYFAGIPLRELPDKLNGIKEYIIGMHDCKRPIHFLDVRIKLALQDLRRSYNITHHQLMTLIYIYNSVYTLINSERMTCATVEVAAAFQDWVAARYPKSHVGLPYLMRILGELKRFFDAIRARRSVAVQSYMYDDAVDRYILLKPSVFGDARNAIHCENGSFVDIENAESYVNELLRILQSKYRITPETVVQGKWLEKPVDGRQAYSSW